jgi:hypothetical protein
MAPDFVIAILGDADASICALRALSRHRASLVESAAVHIQHMCAACTPSIETYQLPL